MTLVRKKLSKSGWLILAFLGIALIIAPILHFTGIFDLSFLGGWAISAAEFMTLSGWNVLIGGLIAGGIGFGLCYVLKDYIIGIEGANLQVTNTGSNYTPLGTTSAPIDNQGTVVNA